MSPKLIVALDTSSSGQAASWVAQTASFVDMYKIGLQYFTSCGSLRASVRPLFYDLKLHDTPRTVRKTVAELMRYKPAMISVCAAGGPKMIAAAAEAMGPPSPARPLIMAVTKLTTMHHSELPSIGVEISEGRYVIRLAQMAISAGADGIICHGSEAARLRYLLPARVKILCPGIRPVDYAADDQVDPFTPLEAKRVGADYIVVGRPITAAQDPAAAAEEIHNQLRAI